MATPSADRDAQQIFPLPPPTAATASDATVAAGEAESQLSSLVYDMSQQVQMAMGTMLKMITEIDENAGGITEEIGKCKDSVLERKKALEEDKERFQKAAFAVLDMLNGNNS